MKRLFAAALFLLLPSTASATGFTDYGQDYVPSTETRYSLHGAFRVRTEALYNLDLDRGPTPSGQLFFPVSISDPKAQTLYYSDMRFRTDLAMYAPGGVVGVKARIDVLDNLAIGGSADGLPGGSTTQRVPASAFRVKRAYGEIVTPVGYLAAGRIGAHWGLGMLVNGGDCLDCDSGDAADRVSFATVALGHIFAAAYDFSSTGYLVPRKDGVRSVEVEPSAAVRSFALAVMQYKDDLARKRRKKAGKTTFEYGAYYAHRWQDQDIPASYLPMAQPAAITSSQVMARGFRANAVDGWLRLSFPYGRIEAEAAYMSSTVDQPSLVPGLLMNHPAQARQYGGVLESDFGPSGGLFGVGFDFGYASGDPTPGFGARPALSNLQAPRPGDLDGPQGVPPYDNRIDNFKFHPDYRIDRILFREIIGTVTDATYLRPHARFRLADFGASRITASATVIVSWANYASSSPGGKKPLGLEIDPTLAYQSDDGFETALEHAVLLPQAGLDNPDLGLKAKPAQLIRLRATFAF